MGVSKKLVYALFDDEDAATRAVEALVEEEFSASNIYVMMRDPTQVDQVRDVPVRTKTMVGPGVAIGAALGAVGGALVTVGGGFLVAGPLVALLQGAVTGGAAGSLAGTVAGLGYWRDVVEFPQEALDEGAILVGVDLAAQGQLARAKRAFAHAGAPNARVHEVKDAARALRQAQTE